MWTANNVQNLYREQVYLLQVGNMFSNTDKLNGRNTMKYYTRVSESESKSE